MQQPKSKQKKCEECKTPFKQFNSLVKWCSPTCGAKLALKAKAKQDEKLRKAQRQKDREWIEANRTFGYLLDKAQRAVNAYIRWRDYGKPCISCNGANKVSHSFRGHAIDGGHYRSTGAAPHMRFRLNNIHGQCVYCNRDLGGNPIEYRKALVNKYGEAKVLEIEHDNRVNKYTKDDLRRIAKIFNKRARWYKKRRERQAE